MYIFNIKLNNINCTINFTTIVSGESCHLKYLSYLTYLYLHIYVLLNKYVFIIYSNTYYTINYKIISLILRLFFE